jgi:hypothetical protein
VCLCKCAGYPPVDLERACVGVLCRGVCACMCTVYIETVFTWFSYPQV